MTARPRKTPARKRAPVKPADRSAAAQQRAARARVVAAAGIEARLTTLRTVYPGADRFVVRLVAAAHPELVVAAILRLEQNLAAALSQALSPPTNQEPIQ